MKHRLLFITLGLFAAQSLLAQQSRTLTLKEAIDLTLANSRQLKLNEAKVLEASANIKEAEEKRLPDAGVSGSYLYLPVRPTINLKSDSAGSGGGPKVSQTLFGTLSVSLPLYNGGKLKYGIESAKYLEQALKLDAENERTAVIMNTINACINLFKAKEAINLVKENLEQSQQRVKDLSNLEKNGLLARNDLLKAELQSSNIELTLLDAQSNYRLASANMDIMLGLPEETDLIPDRNGLALPQSVKSISEYEQDALQNRNDIAAAAVRKKNAELNIKTIKTDYYPSIALTGGYIAADIPKFLTVTNAVTIGVGVKYNINDRMNLSFEISQRFTTTDYLDDVSTTYIGANNFLPDLPNGEHTTAYKLQDRSYELDPNNVLGVQGRQRGFSKQRDQYIFAEIGLSFNISSYRCPGTN